MAHPGYPQPRPAKPPIATTDLTISIGALVLTVVFGVVAAAMGLSRWRFLILPAGELQRARGRHRCRDSVAGRIRDRGHRAWW